MPMLCALFQEQSTWNPPECIRKVVYLLHLLYAFWPKLEVKWSSSIFIHIPIVLHLYHRHVTERSHRALAAAHQNV